MSIMDLWTGPMCNLPTSLILHILGYAPRYGVTQKMIRNHRHYLLASRLLRASIVLKKEEHCKIEKHMKKFDFIGNEGYYQYDDEHIHLGIWTYVNRKVRCEAEYVVIFYP